MQTRLLAAALLLAAPLAAQSNRQPAPSRGGLGDKTGMSFLVEAAFEGGGAEFLELTFTDGSTQTIRAGQGGTFSAGVQFRPASQPRLSVNGTIGYKFVTTAAENASIVFSRIPIEVTARWAINESWSFGGGLVQHTGISFNGDGFIPDFDLDPATGATLEVAWKWLALSYTKIDYKDVDGDTFDAGSVGVGFRWVFGKKQ